MKTYTWLNSVKNSDKHRDQCNYELVKMTGLDIIQ